MKPWGCVLFVIVALATQIGAAPASKPSSKSASRPATRARSVSEAATKAVRAAVLALTAEYQNYVRNPAKSSLRTTSNYFKDHPSSDVTPEAIVAALQAQAGEARATAYLRWQLQSALPDTIDDATAKGLLAAYRSSPGPTMRPGIAIHEQRELDSIARGKKEADAADVTATLEQAISRERNANAPVIAYRDELYRRLPKDADTFAIAMEDAKQRLDTVAEGEEFIKAFAQDVRNWAITSGVSPAQMTQIARAARRLADTKSPQYYTSATWSASAGGLRWSKSSRGIDNADDLKDLAVFLEEQAAAPPLNLEIKDDKKK